MLSAEHQIEYQPIFFHPLQGRYQAYRPDMEFTCHLTHMEGNDAGLALKVLGTVEQFHDKASSGRSVPDISSRE